MVVGFESSGVIKTFSLMKTFGKKLGFVTLKTTIDIEFIFENPLAAN